MAQAQNNAPNGGNELRQPPPLNTFVDLDIRRILEWHHPLPETHQHRELVFEALKARLLTTTNGRFTIIPSGSQIYSYNIERTRLQFVVKDLTPWEEDSTGIAAQMYSVASPELLAILNESPFSVLQQPSEPPPESYDVLQDPVVCTSFGGLEFDVFPVSPFHEPLLGLLSTYFRHCPHFATLVPTLTLWQQSIRIPAWELTPRCLALLVVAFLQSEYKLPNLMDPRITAVLPPEDGVLWPGSPLPISDSAKQSWYDLRYQKQFKLGLELGKASLGEALVEFFRFWGSGQTRDKTDSRVISITSSPWPYRRATSKRGQVVDDGLTRPNRWATAAVVVQDPFLPTHNHAQILPQKIWNTFRNACNAAVHQLKQKSPVHTVFGNAFEPLLEHPFAGKYNGGCGIHMQGIYESSRPSKYVLQSRQNVIRRVGQAIAPFGRQYSVLAFGSTEYGVDSGRSDLDLIIMDEDFPQGTPPTFKGEMTDIYNMRKVGKRLQNQGFSQVVPIVKATVPIVKFYDPSSRLQVDLNCNNRLGLLNTQLLRAYCRFWPTLPCLVFIIKKWAKSLSLNDPSGAKGPCTFSSYCLTLMTVAFLQSRDVLPRLQPRETLGPKETPVGYWTQMKGGNSVWCDTRFNAQTQLAIRGTASPMTLDTALYEWFRFFAYEFGFEDHVLDIKWGGVRPRQTRYNPNAPKPTKSKQPNAKTPNKEATRNLEDEGVDGTTELDNEPEEIYEPADNAVQVVQEGPSEQTPRPAQPADHPQPLEWVSSKYVVVDPFIAIKNCCSACQTRVQDRFQMECQRAAFVLETGGRLSQLFGAESPLFTGDKPVHSHYQLGNRKKNRPAAAQGVAADNRPIQTTTATLPRLQPPA